MCQLKLFFISTSDGVAFFGRLLTKNLIVTVNGTPVCTIGIGRRMIQTVKRCFSLARTLICLAFTALSSNTHSSAQKHPDVVVVRPREIEDVLSNPGMGITTFQRFNGQSLNDPLKWSERGPEAKLAPGRVKARFPGRFYRLLPLVLGHAGTGTGEISLGHYRPCARGSAHSRTDSRDSADALLRSRSSSFLVPQLRCASRKQAGG